MKYIKKFEERYEDEIDDFSHLEPGDILIAKDDVYIRYPKGAEFNYMTPKLSLWGDKLFVKKGGKKKVKDIIYRSVFLSGFNYDTYSDLLYQFFTIKDGEMLKNLRKYNL